MSGEHPIKQLLFDTREYWDHVGTPEHVRETFFQHAPGYNSCLALIRDDSPPITSYIIVSARLRLVSCCDSTLPKFL